MNCPQCGNNNTKRVTTRDPNWRVGAERCQDCNYQGHFLEFLQLPKGRKDVVIGS